MPRLKNISGDDRNIGRVDGPVVNAGDACVIDGDLLDDTGDAYVIGTRNADELFDPDTKERTGFTGDARAWPKSTWELMPEPKKGA